MFGQKLEGKVGSVTADVKDDDGTILRRDTVNLHFEFSKEFAKGLNDYSIQLQLLLRDGELSGARMPLDVGAMILVCKDGNSTVQVRAEAGKLVFKAANKEDANPQAQLSVVIPTEDEPHMWFVKHQRETVDVTITKEQLTVAGT